MSQPGVSIDPWGDKWMKVFWRRPAPDVGERTRRRVSLHLIPYLFFLYILAYLDRVNISAATLPLKEKIEDGGLGLSPDVIGIATGMFFWGYWILEIPSTLTVEKRGARYVFVRILVLWGVMATVIGFVGMPIMQTVFGWLPTLPQSDSLAGRVGRFFNELDTNAAYQLYVLRFLLGLFEGGFFPSVIVYLTHWFRGKDRAKAIAAFMAAIPLSNVIGYPISAAILQKVRWFDLAGWRWIFILEGIVPIFAGIATLFFLPVRPNSCTWLPDDEKKWLLDELQREHAQKRAQHGEISKHVGAIVMLTVAYFCLNVVSYGLNTFMPAIIKSQTTLGTIGATMLCAVPYAMALVGMILNGWHSDRKHERIFHVATPLICLSAGLFATALCNDLPVIPVLILMFWVGPCLYAHLPAYWPIPTMFLGAATAAAAIGFINMIGNLGGTVGPMMVGKAATPPSHSAPANPDEPEVDSPTAAAEAESSPIATDARTNGQEVSTEPASDGAGDPSATQDEGSPSLEDSQPAVASTPEGSAEVPIDAPKEADNTVSFSKGLFLLSPWPLAAAVIILLMKLFIPRQDQPSKD